MPAVHQQTFQVRFYECDAFGQMQKVNYLRRMQEAAFGASAAVGYDFARYNQIGYLWLVRASEVEYLTPLMYGDPFEIKTWVLDFRRFRSRRMYEFRNTRSNQLVARASTDWVYVNSEELRPAIIPQEMRLAFFPEGIPEENSAKQRFPALPEPPSGAVSIQRQVDWADIDMMWHVNNAVYLSYIEAAEDELSKAHQWPLQRMLDAGFKIEARRHQIEYRQPAILDDQLEIKSWYSEVQSTAAQGFHLIQKVADEQVIARAQTDWICMDPTNGKTIPFPQSFLDDINNQLARSRSLR